VSFLAHRLHRPWHRRPSNRRIWPTVPWFVDQHSDITPSPPSRNFKLHPASQVSVLSLHTLTFSCIIPSFPLEASETRRSIKANSLSLILGGGSRAANQGSATAPHLPYRIAASTATRRRAPANFAILIRIGELRSAVLGTTRLARPANHLRSTAVICL